MAQSRCAVSKQYLLFVLYCSAEYPPVATNVAIGVQQVDRLQSFYRESVHFLSVHPRSAERLSPQGGGSHSLISCLARPALLLVWCCPPAPMPLLLTLLCSLDFLCLVTCWPPCNLGGLCLCSCKLLPPVPGPSLTRPQHVAPKPRFTVRLLSVALALCLCCPCESCVRPHGLGIVCRSIRPCDMFVYTLLSSLRDHVIQMMLFLCLIFFASLLMNLRVGLFPK